MITYSEELITPELANEYLKKMVNNRPVNFTVVDYYTSLILRGQFLPNGECIKFNTNGELADGQHRLHAIIKANKGVLVSVMRNCPIADFTTYDTPKVRNPRDIIGMHTNSSAIGSFITSYLKFKNTQATTLVCNSLKVRRISNEDVWQEFSRRQDYWQSWAVLYNRWKSRTRIITAFSAVIAELAYLEELGYEREKLELFIDRLTTFSDCENATITTLRLFLLKQAEKSYKQQRLPVNVVNAHILYALKAYLRGKEIRKIRIDYDNLLTIKNF